MEHIDKDTFKQIFRDHWDAFKAAYPRYDTYDYNVVIQKMLDCGDPEKTGFASFRCMECGETLRISFSCKSSFCLSCSKVYTDRWVEFIGRRLFPGVIYRHFVFTVPQCLHLWFYRNPTLLSPFMRAGHACLLDIFATYTKHALDIGVVMVLQTAGRAGNYNPHLHILVTAGGIDPEGTWHQVNYIPYSLLHRKWQYHLLTMLREQISDPAIEKDIDYCWNTYRKGFVAHIQKGDVPPGGKGLAQYLAKYVVSPPISVRRIERYDGTAVRYWYRDHRTEKIQHETLPVSRFIGRMVQHILPNGFQRIRYYGLHANVRYETMRNILAAIIPADAPTQDDGFRVIPRKSFAELFFQSYGINPLRCPRCGTEMELEYIEHPMYGVIRDYWDNLIRGAPDEATPATGRNGRPMDRTERVVQVSMPLM